MTATSTVSTTDVDVFKRLANQALVDVSFESKTRRATDDIRQALNRAASQKSTSHSCPLTEAVQSETCAPAVSTELEESAAAAGRATSCLKEAENAAAEEEKTIKAARRETLFLPSQTSANAIAKQRALPGSPSSQSARTDQREYAQDNPRDDEASEKSAPTERANKFPPFPTANSDEEDRLEKQAFLIELARLKQKGAQLSREFSIQDSVAELEFEVEKQNSIMTTHHTVGFMRDTLRIIINGLEIGNNRFGPFLSIDGWAESVSNDMSQYERALERIYKRYWRLYQVWTANGTLGLAPGVLWSRDCRDGGGHCREGVAPSPPHPPRLRAISRGGPRVVNGQLGVGRGKAESLAQATCATDSTCLGCLYGGIRRLFCSVPS